ncbi:unnamed protein product [Cladocopium goreaui]|uniref:Ribosomal RNA small subunit methyltransferase F n=1 Tax=Cladocopium goreaui TaxID=2562237 RepID=A0A9P1DNH7_9DINO|nr:unnamed protein product [Cladocopium goreaui]
MIRNGRGTSQALGPMGAAVAASVSAAAPLAKKLTFEVLNLVTQSLPLLPAARGAAVGAVLCAITLPITKCFRSTMNLPLPGNIYKAYGSNFLKDVIYGALRAKISALLLKHLKLNPANATTGAAIVDMFAIVVAACVSSAAANPREVFSKLRERATDAPPRQEDVPMPRWINPGDPLPPTSVWEKHIDTGSYICFPIKENEENHQHSPRRVDASTSPRRVDERGRLVPLDLRKRSRGPRPRPKDESLLKIFAASTPWAMAMPDMPLEKPWKPDKDRFLSRKQWRWPVR